MARCALLRNAMVAKCHESAESINFTWTEYWFYIPDAVGWDDIFR